MLFRVMEYVMIARLVLVGAFVLCVALAGDAEAKVFGRRARTSTSVNVSVGSGLRVAIDANLQTVAQARANAMASRCHLTHKIHELFNCPSWSGLGVGEGIGCSSNTDPKSCATCIVGSVVVADAHAFGRNGQVYRVRFFR